MESIGDLAELSRDQLSPSLAGVAINRWSARPELPLPNVEGFYKARVEGQFSLAEQRPCLPTKSLHVQLIALILAETIWERVNFVDARPDQLHMPQREVAPREHPLYAGCA